MQRPLQWHVGDVVRKMREDRGWTQKQLGAKAGIGRAAVGKVETDDAGQRKGNLAKVAKALGSLETELYAMVPRRTVIESRETPARGATATDIQLRLQQLTLERKNLVLTALTEAESEQFGDKSTGVVEKEPSTRRR